MNQDMEAVQTDINTPINTDTTEEDAIFPYSVNTKVLELLYGEKSNHKPGLIISDVIKYGDY